MSGGIDGVGGGESLVQRRGVWRRGIAPGGGRDARLRRARGHSGDWRGESGESAGERRYAADMQTSGLRTLPSVSAACPSNGMSNPRFSLIVCIS